MYTPMANPVGLRQAHRRSCPSGDLLPTGSSLTFSYVAKDTLKVEKARAFELSRFSERVGPDVPLARKFVELCSTQPRVVFSAELWRPYEDGEVPVDVG